jgi:dTDP-4-dehydrorhamnose 3,5-epimerase
LTDTFIAAGTRDVQTVTPDGVPTAKVIHGVKTRSTPNHVDHRGTVFEIFGGDLEFFETPIVYAYQFSVRPHQMKGWGLHERKTDRYTIISGEVLLFLYDARPDSPTRGIVQRIVLSDRGVRQVVIPTNVWHLSANVGAEEARLINFPTDVYHHEAPDRLLLAWDSPEVPINLRDILPQF